MSKNVVKASFDYTASFQNWRAVQERDGKLTTAFVDIEIGAKALSHFDNDFNLRLEYDSTAIYPNFVLYDDDKSLNLGPAITFAVKPPKDSCLPLAFKRSDDLLDDNGVRLGRNSKAAKRVLELVKVKNSRLKWVVYKVKLFFKKLVSRKK